MKQTTIAKELSFNGIGLHSGLTTNITLLPAEANTGIVFERIDLNQRNTVKATYDNVVDTMLGTTIANKAGTVIQTIEHLMAAIWCANIDNLHIEIDNKETPIMDGSSFPFIEEIEKAGIKELEENRKVLKILKPLEYVDKDRFVKVLPSDKFSVDIFVDYNYGKIGQQTYNFSGERNDFKNEVSKARTFCNFKEIDTMRKVGLAKGGSLDNAMVFNDDGLMNEGGSRYDCEVARHKLLDFIGDMRTSGYLDIIGKFEVSKAGHGIHNDFLKVLFKKEDNYSII